VAEGGCDWPAAGRSAGYLALGGRFPHAQRWVAAAITGVVALVALALFLLDGRYACILASGRANCLLDGAGTLGFFLLGAFLAIRCLTPPAGNRPRAFILMLLLCSALAGMGLAQNLLVLIVFLNLFMFVLYRWLTGKGIQPRFLVLRDDYGDEE